MKAALTAVIVVALSPFLALGLLIGAYRAAAGSDPGCTASPATPAPSPASPIGPTLDGPASQRSAPEATPASACTSAGPQGPATPFTGPDGYVPDPTSHGLITRRMLHTYTEANRVFGGWPWPITCWDPHLWNPTSDHPLGRACDFTVGHLGVLPTPTQHAIGWQLAHWAQANTTALGISYLIWDGHIWSPARASQGWRHYDGGGIYDPTSITGGHFDHVHISVIP